MSMQPFALSIVCLLYTSNYEGVITTYTEPSLPELPCTCDYCTGKKTYKYQGVSALGAGPEIRCV